LFPSTFEKIISLEFLYKIFITHRSNYSTTNSEDKLSFQDDEREEYTRKLFGLEKDEKEGRGGVDAILKEKKIFEFELKTTSTGSVTTVRDFGPDHIQKWAGKHWLIGVYSNGKPKYFLYGSPEKMKPWINEKANYVKPDFDLSKIISKKLSLEDMYLILGRKEKYTLEDAKKLHKKQYKIKEYKKMMDVDNGYSPKRMLKILKDRSEYLMKRGSTLNNPHIPASYFEGWPKIKKDHAKTLRKMMKL